MNWIYATESYEIIGAAMQVYKELGCGFVEVVYQEALEIEFSKRNIPFVREPELKILYGEYILNKTFKPDFICYNKIIVELKAVQELDDFHRSQTYNYLKTANMRLGLLINFGQSDGLEYERRLFTTK